MIRQRQQRAHRNVHQTMRNGSRQIGQALMPEPSPIAVSLVPGHLAAG
jgi:hypothetical protein